MKMIAIIGASASGKSDLAFKIAKKFNGYILSLDSLSIYKQIDIVSAKPTIEQREDIKHFGIDEVYPNEHFSIMSFIEIFKNAREKAMLDNKALIIAGGSSFYLKGLINGISVLPKISDEIRGIVETKTEDLSLAYNFLYKLDEKYMKNIKQNDRYRITRAYEIHLSTNEIMSDYFAKHPRISVIDKIDIFNLSIVKEELRKRVEHRTSSMLDMGLLDEVKMLRDLYGDDIAPMKSIGIKESIDFLDNKIDINELQEAINHNTMKLAKRQKTFNRTQFEHTVDGSYEDLFKII